MSRLISLYRDEAERFAVIHGDAVQLLTRIPDASIDSIITDPPYGIGFNKEAWDRPGLGHEAREAAGFATWTTSWATEARRVLKPGGYLVAFGAPRMFHRLTVGIEDAGFEIRDVIMWLCGQGVPKGRRLPGGFSTTLRPAYEPILLARVPISPTTRSTAGHLSIGERTSRWPQNLALLHTLMCRPDRCVGRCPVRRLDQSRAETRPSRFFYAAKANRAEREAGLEHLPATSRTLFGSHDHAVAPRRNIHPTVKPVELMGWLVRMICPPGGVVLDPFTGSGSTGIAAIREGRAFVGIERESSYVEIACARLAHWSARR